MNRRGLILWLGIPLLFACARHVVVERNLVQSLNDTNWRIESQPKTVDQTEPTLPPDSQPEGDLEQRLRRLERLRGEGLISEEEYTEKRADLLQHLQSSQCAIQDAKREIERQVELMVEVRLPSCPGCGRPLPTDDPIDARGRGWHWSCAAKVLEAWSGRPDGVEPRPPGQGALRWVQAQIHCNGVIHWAVEQSLGGRTQRVRSCQ